MAELPDAYSEYTLHKNEDGYFATVNVDLEKYMRDMITRYCVEKEDAEAERQLAEFGFVKVVRCKDCRYYDLYPNDSIFVCYRFDNEQPIVEPDGFCAWGEKGN